MLGSGGGGTGAGRDGAGAGSGGAGSGGDLGGGYTLEVGGISTTFQGAISLAAPLPSAYRTRPLTTLAQLRLQGSVGLSQPLSTIVRAADAAADAAANALIAASSSSGAIDGPRSSTISAAAAVPRSSFTEAELLSASAELSDLHSGVMSTSRGAAVELLRRRPLRWPYYGARRQESAPPPLPSLDHRRRRHQPPRWMEGGRHCRGETF